MKPIDTNYYEKACVDWISTGIEKMLQSQICTF